MNLPELESAPLDPALAGFLAHLAAQGAPPLEALPPAAGRQIYRELAAQAGLPPLPVGKVEDRQMPGPGGPLALRVYTPLTRQAGPWPVLLYAHGGGWVIGDLETHDAVCRMLCHHSAAVVVAVDYRLAPEHPFPAAPDDVEAALRWVAAHAAKLGADAARVGVAGDSAGANLAAVAAQRVAGAVPLRAAGLIYPVAQHISEPSASYAQNEGKVLTRSVMQWFSACYLGADAQAQAQAAQHPDFALLRSARLHTLPPTWLATMGHDPLRDEGHALARRIAHGGVACTHRHYPGAIHACIHFTAVSPVGSRVMLDLAAWLRERL
jgi:acetyl esterase